MAYRVARWQLEGFIMPDLLQKLRTVRGLWQKT
jgi:hypothetical protein